MNEAPSKIFSKSDYMTPKQVAKELNEDEALVLRAMKNAYLARVTIAVKAGTTTAPRPLVIHSKYSHCNVKDPSRYRLRSDGINNIKIAIEKLKQKGQVK